MKAQGKKNPDIQKDLGVPLSIQSYKNLILSFKSLTHEANGFRDIKPLSANIYGTILSNIWLAICSNSSDITTKPLRPFLTLTRDIFIIANNLLYLTIS